MRIVFGIEVGVEVSSYVQAGEVLDKITQSLDEAVGPKGAYDISNFRTRHKAVHEFSDQPPMQAMAAEMPERRKFDREY